MRHFTVLSMLLICSVTLAGEIFKLGPGRKPERNNYPGSAEERRYKQWIRQQQANWIGVSAPGLGPNAEDRSTTAIKLSDFRGKRVLLYGFFSGNFNWLPDEPQLMGALNALDAERKTSAGRELVVVGFTAGTDLFPNIWGGTETDMHPDLRKVLRFPLALSINRDFPEPYDPILSLSAYGAWGAVLIDQNGVIIHIYNKPLTAGDLRDAVTMPDWKGSPRPVPQPPAA